MTRSYNKLKKKLKTLQVNKKKRSTNKQKLTFLVQPVCMMVKISVAFSIVQTTTVSCAINSKVEKKRVKSRVWKENINRCHLTTRQKCSQMQPIRCD